MTQHKTTQNFIEKYKKWIIALAGVHLVPTILVICAIIGSITYHYINNDANFHPYKSHIIAGFKEGHADGKKNHVFGKHAPWTLWLNYKYDTKKLKERVLAEKEEYLSQFPESERGLMLAEMKTKNIKLPLQLELEKRFISGMDFYADYVKQRVKREDFSSDAEYKKALQDEAWKVGYAHGYNEGLDGSSYNMARDSLR